MVIIALVVLALTYAVGEGRVVKRDVRKCPAPMVHLATGRELKFSPELDLPYQPAPIVLHADKVTFATGDYPAKSRYEGWLQPGSPAAWANEFVAKLETSWRPSTALVPWRMTAGSYFHGSSDSQGN